MKKIILFGAVLASLNASGQSIYDRTNPTVKVLKADMVIPAGELVYEYSTEERIADELYLNKIMNVRGLISEVEENRDGGKMIILATERPGYFVQASMVDKSEIYTKGTFVTIKGKCSGYLMKSVSLTECSINNNPRH